jgi:hypothetical protein
MVPAAGGACLGVVKLRNSMIPYGASPASSAAMEATHTAEAQVSASASENVILLGACSAAVLW